MDPENKSLNFIFPTKYVIPKSLKFSHWPNFKFCWLPKRKKGTQAQHPLKALKYKRFTSTLVAVTLKSTNCFAELALKLKTLRSKISLRNLLFNHFAVFAFVA